MKLIYEIILFPLINKLSLYLILNLLGEEFIRGQCLKGGVGGGGGGGGAYVKVKEIHHIKLQNFVFVPFSNENKAQKPQNQKK